MCALYNPLLFKAEYIKNIWSYLLEEEEEEKKPQNNTKNKNKKERESVSYTRLLFKYPAN